MTVWPQTRNAAKDYLGLRIFLNSPLKCWKSKTASLCLALNNGFLRLLCCQEELVAGDKCDGIAHQYQWQYAESVAKKPFMIQAIKGEH